jgi:hypothetical protein
MTMRGYLLASLAAALCVGAHDARAQASAAQIPQAPAQRSPQPTLGQPIESCIAGRIFGITQYQCTSCGMASPRDSTHVVYSFGAEPLVVETDSPSNRVKPGDHVVAVNGNPITTRVGADHFAYPPQGTATLTVRRNNVNINIDQPVSSSRYCPTQGFRISPDSLAALRASGGVIAVGRSSGGGGGGAGGRGGARQGGAALDSATIRLRSMTGARAEILRTPPAEPVSQIVQTKNFGLTLTCHPTCTFTRTRDGTTQYWRFDAFPTLTNVSPASAAAKAGLRDGDVLKSVNGVSPMVEEGALMLFRPGNESTLHLEVDRGGKIEKITLKL